MRARVIGFDARARLVSALMTFTHFGPEKGASLRLKSGGPIMTCEGDCPSPIKNDKGKWVQCSWFAGTTPRRKQFPVEALERVSEAERLEALEAARARRAGTAGRAKKK